MMGDRQLKRWDFDEEGMTCLDRPEGRWYLVSDVEERFAEWREAVQSCALQCAAYLEEAQALREELEELKLLWSKSELHLP